MVHCNFGDISWGWFHLQLWPTGGLNAEQAAEGCLRRLGQESYPNFYWHLLKIFSTFCLHVQINLSQDQLCTGTYLGVRERENMFINRAHAELSLKKNNYRLLRSDNIGWPSNLDGNDWSRSNCTNFTLTQHTPAFSLPYPRFCDNVILTYQSFVDTNQIDYNLFFRIIDFYLYARTRCFHHWSAPALRQKSISDHLNLDRNWCVWQFKRLIYV